MHWTSHVNALTLKYTDWTLDSYFYCWITNYVKCNMYLMQYVSNKTWFYRSAGGVGFTGFCLVFQNCKKKKKYKKGRVGDVFSGHALISEVCWRESFRDQSGNWSCLRLKTGNSFLPGCDCRALLLYNPCVLFLIKSLKRCVVMAVLASGS